MKKRKTKRNKIMLMVSFGVVLLMLLSSLPVYAEDPPHGTSEAGIVPELADGNPLTGPGTDDHKVETSDFPAAGTKEDIPAGIPGEDGFGDETFEVDWTVSGDGMKLSWQSTSEVSHVVVKGGTRSYIYNYFDGDGNYLALDKMIEDIKYYYDSGLMAPQMKVGKPGSKILKVVQISHFGFFGTGGDDDIGPGGDPENGNGSPPNGGTGSTGTGDVMMQSLTVAPERPLTALPATGGSILPMLALSLLLAGSGAVAIRKFKER